MFKFCAGKISLPLGGIRGIEGHKMKKKKGESPKMG